MERRARDRVSRKRMYLEEKRDTMKLRRVGDRANGLANNFVSVSLVLSFVILPSRPSYHLFPPIAKRSHFFLFIVSQIALSPFDLVSYTVHAQNHWIVNNRYICCPFRVQTVQKLVYCTRFTKSILSVSIIEFHPQTARAIFNTV